MSGDLVETQLPALTIDNGYVKEERRNTYRPQREKSFEGEITHEKLIQLEKVFVKIDADGGGGLCLNEFRKGMHVALGAHLSDEELDQLFMKVDTNCDGTVDWDEYLSYMLLECTEKDSMKSLNQMKPFPQTPRLIQHMGRYQRHRDCIIKAELIPVAVKSTNSLCHIVRDKSGRYVTVTKEGVVNFWNMNLNHIAKIKLPPEKHHHLGVWVTCMTALPNVSCLCIGSTAGNLVFYDINAYRFKPVVTITDLDICITCVNYWVDPDCNHHAKLVFGDARGNIMAIEFNECVTMCFLQATSPYYESSVEFSKLQLGTTCGVKAYKLPYVHSESVIDIKFFDRLMNGSFLSCCRRYETAMYLGDIEAKRGSYFNVENGVQTFDYCSKINIIVTGGKDAIVRVWSPYVPSKPVMLFQGQKTPILLVFIDEEHEQIVSVSQEKDILVFDMLTQTTVQTIRRKAVTMGPRALSTACYNPYRKALVLASNQLAWFEHQEEFLLTQSLHSHTKAVSLVRYNSLFNQLVSAGADSNVCVWNPATGERLMQFAAHKIPQKGGEDEDVEITSMTFDPTQRRLVTGARDGTVKVWNFNSGELLRTIDAVNPLEITGIVCPKQRILTTGWNRLISTYKDSYVDDTVQVWQQKHHEDITCMDYRPPSTVASGSYDGDILIWNLETQQVTIRLNAHVSTKPCYQRLEGGGFDKASPFRAGKSASKRAHNTGRKAADFNLKEWMAYNTNRSSIKAQIPHGMRRHSMIKRKTAITHETKLPTAIIHEAKPRRAKTASGGRLSNVPLLENELGLTDILAGLDIVHRNNTPESADKKRVDWKHVTSQPHLPKEYAPPRRFSGDQTLLSELGLREINVNNNNKLVQRSTKHNTDVKDCTWSGHEPEADDPISDEDENKGGHSSATRRKGFKTFDHTSDDVKVNYDNYLLNEAAIEKLVFLHKRDSEPHTATLISMCGGGWVRFWSVNHKGGLIAQFNAAHIPGDSIQAACVNEEEDYLITGDTSGYIKIWDISHYCISTTPTTAKEHSQRIQYDKFPHMFNKRRKEFEELNGQKYMEQSSHRPPPQASLPDETWIPPPLLISFRGHIEPISDVVCLPGERFATSSSDCSVRVWSIYGGYIGICGQKTPWSRTSGKRQTTSIRTTVTSPEPDVNASLAASIVEPTPLPDWFLQQPQLPTDIRRVGSATTLRILDGKQRRWRLAKNVLRAYLHLSQSRRKQRAENHETTEELLDDVLPTRMAEIDQSDLTSDILGHSYKKTGRHQRLPTLPKIQIFCHQWAVHNTLSCYDLNPIDIMEPPQTILDIQARHLLNAQYGAKSSIRRRRGTNRRKAMMFVPPGRLLRGSRLSGLSINQRPSAAQSTAVPSDRSNAPDSPPKRVRLVKPSAIRQ